MKAVLRPQIEWQVDSERWRTFLAECPQATFFHTPGWYMACAEALGYRVEPLIARFESGRSALLPLATRPLYRGLLREACAGIENGYGGWVSPTPLTREEVESGYRLVRARYAELTVVGNPHERFGNAPTGGQIQRDATQVVPLLAREAQLKGMSATRVKRVKRGAGEGFRLEVREHLTGADVARFYPLYAEHAKDWAYRKWVRDERYFRALCLHAGEQLALFLAYDGEELAGFRLLGLTGPVVMDLYLATSKAHDKRDVGSFLVAEPLAWLFEQGYRAFDFQPSGQLEGVKAFKSSFGAAELPHVSARMQGAWGRSLQTLSQWRRREVVSTPVAP